MTTFFQAHLGDEGVDSDHRNPKTTRPPHQLSGTRGAWLVKAPDSGVLESSLCVFLSVCGSFTCVCIWHLFFCLFVCLFGQSHLEAGGCCPSLCGKWLPRNQVSAMPGFSPSGQLPGLRCRLALLLDWLTRCKIPVGIREARRGALRGRSEAGLFQPVRQSPGSGKCLSQRCPFRVKILKLMKIRRGSGYHTLAADQYILLNKSNPCSFFFTEQVVNFIFFNYESIKTHEQET